MTEQERCEKEIADIKRNLRSGHPDVEGLCRALVDWSAELRIIDAERSLEAEKPAAAEAGRAEGNEIARYFATE